MKPSDTREDNQRINFSILGLKQLRKWAVEQVEPNLTTASVVAKNSLEAREAVTAEKRYYVSTQIVDKVEEIIKLLEEMEQLV